VLKLKDDPDSRLLLAKSLYGLGMYKESLSQASIVNARLGDRESAKVIALDHAGLKDWEAALTYLEKLMAEATEIPVLNLAAECYVAVGRPEKACPSSKGPCRFSPISRPSRRSKRRREAPGPR